MNKVILLGRLTKDVEAGKTASGIAFCRFTIAVQRKFANADGKYEADFLNCTAWRQTAEFVAKYFKKGERILCAGSIQTRSYDGQDGQKKFATDIIIEECEFVEKRDGAEKTEKKQPTLEPVDDDNDLPF